MKYNVNETATDRGQNAKRYGKVGVLVGVLAGVLTGGGVASIVPMALAGGIIGAAGGAAAGNKLNPLFQQVFSFLPGVKKLSQGVEGEALQPTMPQQGAGYGQVESLDHTIRENARAAASGMDDVTKTMDVNAAPLDPKRMAAADWARATNPGTALRH